MDGGGKERRKKDSESASERRHLGRRDLQPPDRRQGERTRREWSELEKAKLRGDGAGQRQHRVPDGWEREGPRRDEREESRSRGYGPGQGRRRNPETQQRRRDGDGVGGRGASEEQSQTIKILYTNAQSVSSKLNELSAVSQDLKPDVILLTETWCNNSVTDASLGLAEYNLETDLRRDRNDTSGGIGGGLLVYTRNNIRILPCDKFSDNEFNQFCSFKISTSGEQLNLILAYRPPSAPQTNTTALCDLLRNMNNNSILIGDINMPNIDWVEEKTDAKGRELLETVTEEGLQQLVSFPTHTKGNILDLVITNCAERVIDIEDVGRLGRSDHCMICVTVECKTDTRCSEGTRYNWSKANKEAMALDLERTDWRLGLDWRTTEDGWRFMKSILGETIDKNVPTLKGNIKFKHPWMTRDILKLIRKKRRKWRKAKNSASEWEKKEYKKIEKEVANKIRNAKRKLEKDLVAGEDRAEHQLGRL
jgi:hypothetical protein